MNNPYDHFNDAFYTGCNIQRFNLLEHLKGKDFFKGKTVLELGGGLGNISGELQKWGAICTVYEGRQENIATGKSLYPEVEYLQVDLQNEIPDRKFDVVLNFGVFYHLSNPEHYITETAKLFREFMLLDGNISITTDRFLNEDVNNFSNSMHGEVKFLTESTIHTILNGYELTKLDEKMDQIGGSRFRYAGRDWLYDLGQRRMMLMINHAK